MRIQSEEYSWLSTMQNGTQSVAAASTSSQTVTTGSKTDEHNASAYAQSIDGDTVELSQTAIQVTSQGTQQQASTATGTHATTTTQSAPAGTEATASAMNSDGDTAELSQAGRQASAMQAPMKGGGQQPAQTATNTSTTTDDQIENLEKEQDELEKQLQQMQQQNTEEETQDQKVQSLKNQIQQIEAEIQQLEAQASESAG